MVRAATIPAPQIDVNTPCVGRYLRSDLTAASDLDSVTCYDSHEPQILSRHDRKGRVHYKVLRELPRTRSYEHG
jgi:hypothetical protein